MPQTLIDTREFGPARYSESPGRPDPDIPGPAAPGAAAGGRPGQGRLAGMTISITALERAAAAGWRGAEEEWLGGWLLRATGGFTGRANSALATGNPGRPRDAALEAAPVRTRPVACRR